MTRLRMRVMSVGLISGIFIVGPLAVNASAALWSSAGDLSAAYGYPTGTTTTKSSTTSPDWGRARTTTTSTSPSSTSDPMAMLSGYGFDSGVATALTHVAAATGAEGMHNFGYNGRGIGVALIDTGVAPVQGLTSGNVRHGADLSFESQDASLRHLDTFGHGTHMAGIIAGNDSSFRGMAPGARLTSIKVAGADGAVDVSQVVAAVDWVVAHRNDDPSNPIRVLNLSYGTDGVQDYRYDPLTHAVENAWRAGIVVVVAAGNNGKSTSKLNNPAYDPFVIAVGASDTAQTSRPEDDTVLDFSSRGDASRGVDLVAPGRSIVSLRAPGSGLDERFSAARYNTRFFKGSGTSQAAAVVSGAAALLISTKPNLRPDEVKALLKQNATRLDSTKTSGFGAGELHVGRAWQMSHASGALPVQAWEKSTGLGSLEAARGTQHVSDGEVELTGERHILGPFVAAAWAPQSARFAAWNGGTWGGSEWLGTCLCESSSLGLAWSGRLWASNTWAGRTWTGRLWAGRTWTGTVWR